MKTPSQTINPSTKNVTYWRQHYQQYLQSGLTKTAYSREQKLMPHRFMYWSRKLEVSINQAETHAENHFISVKMKSTLETQSRDCLCSLEINGNQRLLIHDVSVLKLILNFLESRS